MWWGKRRKNCSRTETAAAHAAESKHSKSTRQEYIKASLRPLTIHHIERCIHRLISSMIHPLYSVLEYPRSVTYFPSPFSQDQFPQLLYRVNIICTSKPSLKERRMRARTLYQPIIPMLAPGKGPACIRHPAFAWQNQGDSLQSATSKTKGIII